MSEYERLLEYIKALQERVAHLERCEYIARASNADLLDGLHADATGAADAHVVATDANGAATVVDLTATGGLNVGTATGAGTGQAFLKTSNWPVLKVERSTTAITDAQGGLYLLATTSGNMVDGFGTEFHFVIRDSAGVDNDIARLQAIRAGADNSGALTFGVKNAGSWVEAFRAVPSGRVLIGTTSDDGINKLQVSGSIKATGGLNLGTATGAGAGEIRASGQITSEGRFGLLDSGSTADLTFTFPVTAGGAYAGRYYEIWIQHRTADGGHLNFWKYAIWVHRTTGGWETDPILATTLLSQATVGASYTPSFNYASPWTSVTCTLPNAPSTLASWALFGFNEDTQ